MSATISSNDSKFVIFGSGHDYTRVNSGKGEKVFFSHPKVPVGGKNYAGQYLFYVQDEDGNYFDAVKDDLEHCTFTPALGSTFDIAGETTISVLYQREYIHDEETILIEKQLSQKIEVVDHGAKQSSSIYDELYADGYLYVHPNSVSEVYASNQWRLNLTSGKKVSCVPWRTGSLRYFAYNMINLEDLTELADADFSQVRDMEKAFYGCAKLESLEGLESVSGKLTSLEDAFNGCSLLEDIKACAKWDTSNVTTMIKTFYECVSLLFEGLENWNVEKVIRTDYMFYGCTTADLTPLSKWKLKSDLNAQYMFAYATLNPEIPRTTLHGLEDWDISNLIYMQGMFAGNRTLTDISALAKWNTSNVTNMQEVFKSSYALKNLTPLANWNTGKVTTMQSMFDAYNNSVSQETIPHIKTLNGLQNWNVSKVTNFSDMFTCQYWLEDVSALANWNVSSCTDFSRMFCYSAIEDTSAFENWNVSHGTTFNNMFSWTRKGHYDNGVYDVDVINENNYGNHQLGTCYDYEGNTYLPYWNDFTPLSQDASGTADWNVTVTGNPSKAFYDFDYDTTWSNIPAWNNA